MTGIDVGLLGAAHVGGGDGKVVEVHGLDIGDEDRAGPEVIDGDVEEALDLGGVQFAGHHAVATGCGEHVGYQFRGDGNARTVFAVLAGPAEVGDDGNHLVGGSPAGGVDHQQQFEEIVCRRIGALDNEYRRATDAFRELGLEFAVAETGEFRVTECRVQLLCNLLCEDAGTVAGEDLQSMVILFHKIEKFL